MATERVNDLRAFKGFIEEKLSNGEVELTPEEALAHWEIENQTGPERAAAVEAVREALADMRAGDAGIPAREFLADIRRKYNLPTSA